MPFSNTVNYWLRNPDQGDNRVQAWREQTVTNNQHANKCDGDRRVDRDDESGTVGEQGTGEGMGRRACDRYRRRLAEIYASYGSARSQIWGVNGRDAPRRIEAGMRMQKAFP